MAKFRDWSNLIVALVALLVAFKALLVAQDAADTSPTLNNQQKEIGKLTHLVISMAEAVDTLGKISKYNSAQISQLTELNSKSARQLDVLHGELDQLKVQSTYNKLQAAELQKQGKQISEETRSISMQLDISQRQQKEQLKLAFLTKKMYVTRLKYSIVHMQNLYPLIDLEDFQNRPEKQIVFLSATKDIMERELNNYVMLEDDSLSSNWIRLYELLESQIKNLQIWGLEPQKGDNDKTHSDLTQEEIKQKRFNETFFEWRDTLLKMMRIIQNHYQTYNLAKQPNT
jgi:hypothetical protein